MIQIGRYIARLFVALVVLFVADVARAADVSIEVSSRAVMAGERFTLSVIIDRAQEYDPPALPELEGIVVESGPFRQTSRTSSNGRVVQDAITFTWQLVALKAGEYAIPAVTVVADGQNYQSKPITIVATVAPPALADADDVDLLFARVVAERDTIYLGEPLRLTLQVWIRPFQHRQLNGGALDSEQMWRFIDTQNSEWGDFAAAVGELRTSPFGERSLRGRREVLDRGGVEQVYYRYELDVEFWPRQAGPLTLAPVRVRIEYPKDLQRSRTFGFNRGLQVSAAKTLAAGAALPDARVLSPPELGRPPTYNGAVGRFGLRVTARPTEVAVGDPITLTLTIDDRTPGGTRLDLLPAPPLERVPEIDRDFKVPTDPVTGIVRDRRKTFTQTVRAKHDGVSMIPAIPLAYFDPTAEAYVTVESTPIPLEVRPSSTLSMTDVVEGAAPTESRATELTQVAGGLLANASGPELLRTERGFEPHWIHAALLGLPCLLFAGVAIGQRQARRVRGDTGYARRRGAKRNALKRIADARRSEGNHQADRIASAVSDYVADRCNAPAGTLTRADVGARLTASGVPPELSGEVETLLGECEHLRFAGGAAAETDSILDRAARCIARLERERLR